MNSTEISVANKINELYHQAESLAMSVKKDASRAIAIAVECGSLLCEQKKIIGHGKWLEWLKDNCPDISERTAQKYMRLNRTLVELSTSKTNEDSDLCGGDVATRVSSLLEGSPKNLNQAYKAAGIIPDVVKESNPNDTTEPTITFTRHIDALVIWYRKRTEIDPIENWQPHVRKLLINELRPWVNIYNDLVALNDNVSEDFDS